MSGTLPSVNKPSIGGRVARAAARGSLKLGVTAFNKMFPTISRFVTKPKTAAAVEPDSVNTSSEDISRSLFRQRVIFRNILDNQLEQNRLLERLLVVYKNKAPVAVAGPGPTPPPSPTPNLEIDLPMPGLPDRAAPRPQQQRPAPNRQRSLLRRYLTFLKRKSPRLFRAAARRLSVAFASLAVPGPGWLVAIITGIGSLFLAYELLQVYREFRASNTEEEDENIENDLPSEEEAAAEERLMQQERDREMFGDVSEIGETQNLNEAEQAVLEAQRQESERRRQQAGLAGNLQDPRRQQLMENLARAQADASRLRGRRGAAAQEAVRNAQTALDNYNRANPIAQADAERITQPPAMIGPPRPSREELIANRNEQMEADLAAARTQAQEEESRQTRTADPLDAALTSAINNAESIAGTANVDDAIRQAENIAASASGAAVPLVNAIRVEGDTIIYDFDKIKYEAERIKFEGLSIPMQQGIAEPVSAPPPAVSGGTNASAAAGTSTSGFRPMQVLTPGLVITTPQPSGAVPLTPGQSATSNQPAAVAPVTGTTAQILATIRARESGGNYQAQSRASTASGAYQFINSTWRSVSRKFNIGTEFERAVDAPPAIQDAVAAAYVEDILRANNNNVAVVPLVWYTGNAQGRMSDAALAANRGLTAETYQRNWMASFAAQGGQTQVAQAPASGPTLAQASTTRVVADREQAMNTQRMARTFNQEPVAMQQQAKQAVPKTDVAEVPIRSRILEAFNYLARAS